MYVQYKKGFKLRCKGSNSGKPSPGCIPEWWGSRPMQSWAKKRQKMQARVKIVTKACVEEKRTSDTLSCPKDSVPHRVNSTRKVAFVAPFLPDVKNILLPLL